MSKNLKISLVFCLLQGVAGVGHARGETLGPALFSAALAGGTLTVGSDCSDAAPCNARVGNTVYSFKAAATIKSGGSTSGLVFIYIDRSGDLIAGSNVALSCQRCTYDPKISQFPSDSIPLYMWTVVGGAFDPKGKTDFRSVLSTKAMIGGAGVEISESAGTATVSVDSSLVSVRVLDPPKNSRQPCSTGQFSLDADHYYMCVAPNKWKRVALTDF